MKTETNQGTIRELQGILDAHDDAPRNIRFYKESSCCGGDAFGIVVDEVFEDDIIESYQDLNFVMDTELYEETGDMIIEYLGNGFFVEPVNKKESKCGGCHEKGGKHEHGSGGCSGCQH